MDQGVGEPEHVLGDRAPLGAVAVQQGVGDPARGDQGELPGQVVRVEDAGVQALAARRAVDVHRVAGQQHPAAPVGAGGPAVAAEAGQPGGVGHGDRPGRPLTGQPLDLRQGGGLLAALACEGQGQPPAMPAHREENDREPVAPEERVHRVLAQVPVRQVAAELHVGEEPVLRVGLAAEGQAELAPDPAVRAVAADDVPGRDRPGPARRAGGGRGNGVVTGGEAGELGARLDHSAQLGDPGAEEPFGLVLREVEQEAEPGAAAGELQAGQAAVLGVEAELADQLAALGEAVGQAHHVQDLQRAGVDADRPGLQGHPGALVDDAGADPAGEQLGGEHEPGRAGPDDQHLAVGLGCVHAANSASAGASCHPKPYVADYVSSGSRPCS